jgi:hypothetical protein
MDQIKISKCYRELVDKEIDMHSVEEFSHILHNYKIDEIHAALEIIRKFSMEELGR